MPLNSIFFLLSELNFIARGIWKQDSEANIWTQEDENVEWKRLQNEELYNSFHLPNIVRVMKSRRLSWAGHVAWMEEGRSTF